MLCSVVLPSVSALVYFVGVAEAQPLLPVVDLGYAVHQATLNSSGVNSYYNFSNIRYGQPPLDSLRFAPPLPPTGRNATINNGQQAKICPQAATAGWELAAPGFISAYLTGGNISQYTSLSFYAELMTPVNISTLPPQNPSASEDCLFLDVVVPKSIFDSNGTRDDSPQNVQCEPGKPCTETPAKAPVLVWIYGGGFAFGSKTSSGSPAGLLARSLQNGSEGVIFVAMNYRLGLFGWLAGNENVTSNAGLLDQRLALEWVQQNIHLFGGDPNRVTVMGESAGGASIMHHITSYGGKGDPVPFQQAIPQSAAFQPLVPSQSRDLFARVLKSASDVTQKSIATANDLRALSTKTLITLNSFIIAGSMYGSFTFGPSIDPGENSYVPDIPARLIAQGNFHNVSVMVGHNSNEGLLFTPPFIQTQSLFQMSIQSLFPSANASLINYITDNLYPPVYNGSYGYLNPIGRTALTIADFVVNCNAFAMASSLFPSYAYIFPLGSGLHGSDVPYTFFNGDTSTSDDGYPVFPLVATTMQRYLTEFAMTGRPMAEGNLPFLMYGQNDTSTNIDVTDLGKRIRDPAAKDVCDFWNSAPYYAAP